MNEELHEGDGELGTAGGYLLDLRDSPGHYFGVFVSNSQVTDLREFHQGGFSKELIGGVDIDNRLASAFGQVADLHPTFYDEIETGAGLIRAKDGLTSFIAYDVRAG